MHLHATDFTPSGFTLCWAAYPGAARYRAHWSDRETDPVHYKPLPETADTRCAFTRAPIRPFYFYVQALDAAGGVLATTDILATRVAYAPEPQLEALSRGLVAVVANTGVFLSWRLLSDEVTGARRDALIARSFDVYRNGARIANVADSTNYLDPDGGEADLYAVSPAGGRPCEAVRPWGKGYYDLPLKKPAGGVTPAGDPFEYTANDMSVGDVDGDGEYEYIVKWDPTNSQDVSIKGYTGRCLIDCYKLDGTLLWRLDMGPNIRAGAHYTQFMVMDFDGDGRAEMSVKTAPGTVMTTYNPDGSVRRVSPITLPKADVDAGVTHEDNYVCSAESYRQHLADMFRFWNRRPEVKSGQWPASLEACFGIKKRYLYPLSDKTALEMADYFLDVYAPGRSPRNELRKFEGFIYEGPEYLTLFAGDGSEMETIPFPFPRVDDGLLWGDYAWNRIEPCNRVDRFLSGVAYLDGRHPSLIICRGYYTRSCVAAYDVADGRHVLRWSADSGFLPMKNPFCSSPDDAQVGSDPVYGALARQGSPSLSCADVDGDGCMEILFGAACIDHDGTLLYAPTGRPSDARTAMPDHGDSMHAADVDPDVPGLEILNAFETERHAPCGFALRDAESGEVRFGASCEDGSGRCMAGKLLPHLRGWQVWSNGLYTCRGERLPYPPPAGNARIFFMGDLTTQVIDGADGSVFDYMRGGVLAPEGSPCLIADVLGDFREELLLRTADSSAIRICTTTDLTPHKLPTLMHDPQYRCGVAGRNSRCQPAYPAYYYGPDMDFRLVRGELGDDSH